MSGEIRFRQLSELIANTVQAWHSTKGRERYTVAHDGHGLTLEQIELDLLPSGSGIDSGTSLDLDKSTGEKLVFLSSFHTMNENGFYTGWADFTVIVEPSLIHGLLLKVKGRNGCRLDADLRDCLYQEFECVLTSRVYYDTHLQKFRDERWASIQKWRDNQ